MIDYKLRKFNDNDYEYVYNLKKICYKNYVEEFWGCWIENEQREFFKKYIDKQKDHISIIELSGKPIGFFDDNLENDKYEINNICLEPEWRNRGIGSQILTKALNEHADCSIFIQCFISNPVADLYLKHGFVEVERTRTHIKFRK